MKQAAEAVAKLYLSEITYEQKTGPYGTWEDPPGPKRASFRTLQINDRQWERVTRKFPYLSPQIMGGIRSTLKNARMVEDNYPDQIDHITKPLISGLTFTQRGVKEFLQDIFIRRIMIENEDAKFSYVGTNAGIILGSVSEAKQMREELGLENGVSEMTLEDAVRAAIVGHLSLTRQTPPPLRSS